jgi:hypothetical protein
MTNASSGSVSITEILKNRTILYLDYLQNADILVQQVLPSLQSDCLFFIAHPVRQREIYARLIEQGWDEHILHARFCEYETIGPQTDPLIFSTSAALAEALVAHLRAEVNDPHFATILADHEAAFVLRFRDMLSTYIREEFYFQRALTAASSSDVIFLSPRFQIPALLVSGRARGWSSVQGDMKVLYPIASAINKKSGHAALVKQMKKIKDRFKFPLYKRPWTFFNFRRFDVIVVGNPTDKLSRGNLMPILAELAKRGRVLFLSAPRSMETARTNPQYEETGFEKVVAAPRITLPQPATLSEEKKQALTEPIPGVDRAFEKLLLERLDLSVNSMRGVYSLMRIKSLAAPTLRHAQTLRDTFSDVLRKARCAVVGPGRLFESLMIATLGKKLGVRTYEIQNGTISATGRFVPPLTDKIFVSDQFSRQVMIEHMKVRPERIIVCGSPRMDALLKPVREHSPENARIQCYPPAFFEGKRNLLYATQPVGVERAAKLFSVLLEACLPVEDLCVAVRLHPSEASEYLEAYRKEIAKAGFPEDRILFSQGTYLQIQAADIVCTHYSTIGMEALALGKWVISLAPDNQPAPFDICVLGAEGPVTTAEQLRDLLTRGATDRSPDRAPQAEFAAGNSIERILSELMPDGGH